jgi:TetR/AcrR family transcriptional regulator
VDILQVHLACFGANVFYFLSAPIWRMLIEFDPFDPVALAERRKALVEFLGHALFVDRARGVELARRVIADTPMPELNVAPNMLGGNNERKK